MTRLFKKKFTTVAIEDLPRLRSSVKGPIEVAVNSSLNLYINEGHFRIGEPVMSSYGTKTNYLSSLHPKTDVRARKAVPENIKAGFRYHATIGSDPEFFVENADTGEIVPAFELFRSKASKDPCYWDGYQAEFAPLPAACLDAHRGYVAECLSYAVRKLREKGKNLRISVRNTVEIPEIRLLSDHPRFVNFGCKPSFNVYDEKSPIADADPRAINIRSAGGHIHITLPEEKRTSAYVERVVKSLDAILGVCSVAMFQKYDDPRRRLYYGRAGEFRITPYGVEYRVLSNAWIIHPVFYNLVYELMRRAVSDALDCGTSPLAIKWAADEQDVRNCINNCDVALAKGIIKANKAWLMNRFSSFAEHKHIVRDILAGLHTRLRNPDVMHCMLSSPSITISGAYSSGAPLYWD